jgi:hypothetical protein
MKTFVTFFVSMMLSSFAAGQPYRDGVEYKAENNTYRCRYSNDSRGRHYYEFKNTKNVLEHKNAGILGEGPGKLPSMESKWKLLELLCEVYGDKEKMQTMSSETVHLYFYIGMDSKVKEMRITFSTDAEYPKTTIFQLETIENLTKERIRFVFDPKYSPYYRNALYETSSVLYKISEIPELLEKMQ